MLDQFYVFEDHRYRAGSGSRCNLCQRGEVCAEGGVGELQQHWEAFGWPVVVGGGAQIGAAITPASDNCNTWSDADTL